jgi:hypothetical protein
VIRLRSFNPPRFWLAYAAIAAALVQLAIMGARLAGAHDLLLANGQPLFGDFIAFWSAGRLALAGRAQAVHDIAAIHAQHLIAIPDLSVVAPYHSPPTFLLLLTPFAALPYPAAALLFLALTAALYLYAAHKILPGARAMIFAITLPAALFHLGSVQTGLLIAGLSALAFVWLDTRPRAAGLCIALIAIKPHLALIWPLYLLITRRWRVLAYATGFMGALVLAAGWAFGFDSYTRFLENLPAAQALLSQGRISSDTAASLYANLIGLGAPHGFAVAAHGASALAALIAAALVFSRNDKSASAAALCAATLLLSPYLYFYDLTLLAIGAALLAKPRDRFELAAQILAWSAGFTLALGALITLPLAPLAAWTLLFASMRRAGIWASHPAPAPRT